MRRLPPLRSLEAFVRTAKLGSAKAAASELSLSPPALSRRIKALEDFMGKPLFERKSQAMFLNSDGQMLMAAVDPVLESLSEIVDELAGEGGEYRLRLGVLPLFGTQRLIPRLPELRKLFPKLHIDVDTSGHAENLLGDVVDAAIIIADSVDPKLYSVRLDRNTVYAIASEAMMKEQSIKTPADLKNHTVLVHSDMPLIFDAWRTAIGQPKLKPHAVDMVDSVGFQLWLPNRAAPRIKDQRHIAVHQHSVIFKVSWRFDCLFIDHFLRRDGIDRISVQPHAIQFRINRIGDDDRGIDDITQQIFSMARRIDINVQFRE